ncbi:MAG: hypothetical protein QXT53_05390 [Ignisphaera sp.]
MESYYNTTEKPSIICVANPSPIYSGGGLRALRSLKEYSRHFKMHLFLLRPPFGKELERDNGGGGYHQKSVEDVI